MRLLLFDIDGTLVKTRGLGRRALDVAFRERYGWDDATREVDFKGSTDPQIVRDTFRARGRSEAEARAETAALLGHYEEVVRRLAAEAACDVLPGVRPLLGHLERRSDCRLALLTGNTAVGAEVKLELVDLWRYFPFGAFGDDADERVGLLPVALERARGRGEAFAPGDAVVIGDTARDVEVAKAHGAVSVAVASGWVSADDLARSEPDVLLEDLGCLDAALASLLG